MERGLVSVIVAVYNVEKYLNRGLTSLQEQTYGNLQIILIDDCSTDFSYEMCKSLAEKDRRIEVHQMQTNSGIAAVRNLGIRLSRGEYIGFFDPDDYVDKDFIFTLYNAATVNNTRISVCNAYREDEDGIEHTADSGWTTVISADELFQTSMVHCSFGVWNKLWHHSLIWNFEFNETITCGSDLDTYKLVFKVDKIAYVSKAKYHYLFNSSSISHKNSLEFRMVRLEIIDEMIDYIDNHKPHLLPYAYFLSCRTRRNFILILFNSQINRKDLINREITKTRFHFQECESIFSKLERFTFKVLFYFPNFYPTCMRLIHKLKLVR